MTDTELRVEALRIALNLGTAILDQKTAGKPVTDQSVLAAAELFYRFLKQGTLQ